MTDPLKLTSHGILLLVCYYTRYTRYHTILYYNTVYYLWSADLSKSFSQLIVSIFAFSHYFFNRFCLVEKCGAKNRLNDFTSISIEFQYKRDLSVCSKLFIAFISLKWLVSPRCSTWHTFDSIYYIYTSKVIKYISPLIFLKAVDIEYLS